MTAAASERIKKRLEENGIKKAAIIDDAYDLPTVGSFNADEMGDFWTTIERDGEMIAKLRTLGPGIVNREDIDDEVIKKLWQDRGNLGKLESVCDKVLFTKKLQMLKDVIELENHLKGWGLEVTTLGSEDELNDTSVGLVFIDYYLEPLQDTSAGHVAVDKVRNMLKLWAVDPKPFFVLMSAKGGVSRLVDKFCDDTGLLKGLFDFMPKADLSAKAKLCIKLNTWAIGIPIRHKIQNFADAVGVAVVETTEKFKRRVRGLSLEDYAYIQLLCLQEEGQPLGQYMLWLFKSLLPHIAFEEDSGVQNAKKVLDQLTFPQFLPSQRPPSVQLAEMYRIALSEPITDDVRSHPRINGTATIPNPLPHLQFGDLFIKQDENIALMVASPACDLAFAPDAKRQGDPDYSIVLIPGQLRRLSDSVEGKHVTPLFDINGQPYRIVWDYRHIRCKKHGEVMDLVDKEGYSLTMRLRLPYAIQIQQEFANNLTRVGLPIAPPRYELVDVESYCEGQDGNFEKLREPVKDGAFIIHLGRKYELVLTVECIQTILPEIEKILQLHQQKLNLCSSRKEQTGTVAGLKVKIERLQECQADGGALLTSLEKPWKLPSLGKYDTPIPNLLRIFRNAKLEGLYGSNPPICLNINYGIKTLTDGEKHVEATLKTDEEIQDA